jgi:hypothetical protein
MLRICSSQFRHQPISEIIFLVIPWYSSGPNLFHGREFFFRSCLVVSQSVNFPYFMHFFHNSPPLAPTQSQINPVHKLPPYFFKINLCLNQDLPNSFFPSGFPTKTFYVLLLSPTHAAFPAHIVLLWYEHLKSVWWAAQITLFCLLQSPSYTHTHSSAHSVSVFLSVHDTKIHTQVKRTAGIK